MERAPTMPTPIDAWRVHQYREGDRVRIAQVEPSPVVPPTDSVTLRSIHAVLPEDAPPSDAIYEEKLVRDAALPPEARLIAKAEREAWPGSEVRTLVNQGPTTNRINLTIVGDGYTDAEKDRFFADAQRITDDLFAQTTFKSYLPLFNVHAVFVPSQESGLSDGADRNTALGLYREPVGSKRAIMPGNYGAIERAIGLAPATDYPILMANDDYYGGLGGQYAITTRSPQSGSMVLRHELGHNFGEVGEEYDGGYVYSGANASRSSQVPWKKWVDGETGVGSGKALVGEYPWKNLAEGPLQYRFNVPDKGPENPQTIQIDVSSVGWETPDDVSILLDGQPVPYQGIFTDDRSFFKVKPETSITPGRHNIEFRENVHDGNNVLALVRVTSYDKGYDFTRDKVGAYPSFNSWNQHVAYRPTHESCLMRDMRSTEFCAIDKENMWHQFLSRVCLVDAVGIGQETDCQGRVQRFVYVETPELPGLDLRWYKVGADGREAEIPELHNQRRWNPAEGEAGSYKVRARFETPEVREYNDRFTSEHAFTLNAPAAAKAA